MCLIGIMNWNGFIFTEKRRMRQRLMMAMTLHLIHVPQIIEKINLILNYIPVFIIYCTVFQRQKRRERYADVFSHVNRYFNKAEKRYLLLMELYRESVWSEQQKKKKIATIIVFQIILVKRNLNTKLNAHFLNHYLMIHSLTLKKSSFWNVLHWR